MHDCHKEVLKYHNHNVTLPQSEQQEMRDRRDTNRKRLKDGLAKDKQPVPKDFQSQGSYAHRTMVQHPDKDYDIDDGVLFDMVDLKGPRGGDLSPNDAKNVVRNALQYGRFTVPPAVRTNCVRVYYDKGYHMDVPVYREVVTEDHAGEEHVHWEIASSEWKVADPKGVTEWFQTENQKQSPDTENGRQLRRVVRLMKAFARSRSAWKDRIASGFMISVLVVEQYKPDAGREDQALYDTMVAIRDRLQWNLEVAHPVVEGDYLTKGPDDGKAKFLREKLDWAMEKLDVLSDSTCTNEQALKAWDTVFSTDFFIGELSDDDTSTKGGASAASVGLLNAGQPKVPVDKRGGGRYA